MWISFFGDNLSGGGGDNLLVKGVGHSPLWHGGTTPPPPVSPLTICQNVVLGGTIP